jgi:hypothetical protein
MVCLQIRYQISNARCSLVIAIHQEVYIDTLLSFLFILHVFFNAVSVAQIM